MSNCCGTVTPARTRWANGTPAFETRSVRIANRFTIEERTARLHTRLTVVSLRSVHELDLDTGPLRARVRPVRLARRHRRRRRRDRALGPRDRRPAPLRGFALLLTSL